MRAAPSRRNSGGGGAPSPPSKKGPAAAASKADKKPARERLVPDDDGDSPRLIDFGEGEVLSAAPLLPPPAVTDADEERFCIGGPDISGCGEPKSSSTAMSAKLTFAQVVSRVEAAINQAALLLSDRLLVLQRRCKGIQLDQPQMRELFDIADGIAAAAYHSQKWAYLLQFHLPPGVEAQPRKPTKPTPCPAREEAFACFHITLPRLMVSSSLAQQALNAILKAQGDNAEAFVNNLKIPTSDLRALAPHLERLVMRAGRLSSAVRPALSLTRFIPEYFGPVIGKSLAVRLLPYIIDAADG
mmetsp:Transcript_37265/g.107638  ORF Transcript_37265/g.107638 Transcript_37265/m.107638 type:complete len:300 (+) Transcript_37265:100-999(+)